MKITFIPSSEQVERAIDRPQPASQVLPDWYKRAHTGRDQLLPPGELPNRFTYKACMPFGDAMRHGYIQSTWCDVMIDTTIDEPSLLQRTLVDVVGSRNNTSGHHSYVPRDIDFIQMIEFTWKMAWIPKTPKGWSVLITHPLNRFDLPFMVTSGIIDSDRFHHAPFGNIPFYMKRNYKGIIPAGTPMFQILPIRREKRWDSTFDRFDLETTEKAWHLMMKRLTGSYRDLAWVPKRFR